MRKESSVEWFSDYNIRMTICKEVKKNEQHNYIT